MHGLDLAAASLGLWSAATNQDLAQWPQTQSLSDANPTATSQTRESQFPCQGHYQNAYT